MILEVEQNFKMIMMTIMMIMVVTMMVVIYDDEKDDKQWGVENGLWWIMLMKNE